MTTSSSPTRMASSMAWASRRLATTSCSSDARRWATQCAPQPSSSQPPPRTHHRPSTTPASPPSRSRTARSRTRASRVASSTLASMAPTMWVTGSSPTSSPTIRSPRQPPSRARPSLSRAPRSPMARPLSSCRTLASRAETYSITLASRETTPPGRCKPTWISPMKPPFSASQPRDGMPKTPNSSRPRRASRAMPSPSRTAAWRSSSPPWLRVRDTPLPSRLVAPSSTSPWEATARPSS